jgi:hypothetical protein
LVLNFLCCFVVAVLGGPLDGDGNGTVTEVAMTGASVPGGGMVEADADGTVGSNVVVVVVDVLVVMSMVVATAIVESHWATTTVLGRRLRRGGLSVIQVVRK